MGEGTNQAPVGVSAVGLVAHIEKLFAETGDAALHGLRHLAAAIEAIPLGGVDPGIIAGAIKDEVRSIVSPFLTQLEEAMKGRIERIEQTLTTVVEQTNLLARALPPVPEAPASAEPAQPVAGAALPADGSAPQAAAAPDAAAIA